MQSSVQSSGNNPGHPSLDSTMSWELRDSGVCDLPLFAKHNTDTSALQNRPSSTRSRAVSDHTGLASYSLSSRNIGRESLTLRRTSVAHDIERRLAEMQRILENCAMEDFETTAKEESMPFSVSLRKAFCNTLSLPSKMSASSSQNLSSSHDSRQFTATEKVDMATQTDGPTSEASTQTEVKDAPNSNSAQHNPSAISRSPYGTSATSVAQHPRSSASLSQSLTQVRSSYGPPQGIRRRSDSALLPSVPEFYDDSSSTASSACVAVQANSEAQAEGSFNRVQGLVQANSEAQVGSSFKITEDMPKLCHEQPDGKLCAKILAEPSVMSWAEVQVHAISASSLSEKILEQRAQIRRLHSLMDARRLY
eukprot:gnl/MRDRNA2_/MRDRNA2_155837_c0_seq1.p1 gnl/MRDRNA2_/MRDRNA2_155837_c0~~gnl/MRDRNA2_/MRDRNA2_155837_c0_seq1.p1  ORF type:complete len:423 (-),score=80.27 gnl/MRDRNA2_/MRDRNA2_155837_c0_seq1:409-1503(-)